MVFVHERQEIGNELVESTDFGSKKQIAQFKYRLLPFYTVRFAVSSFVHRCACILAPCLRQLPS